MKKGEVWLVEIPTSIGHEQHGFRPVIIFSQPEANVIAIIPFTTNLKYKIFGYTLSIKPSINNRLKEDSIALIFQIRVIDINRLKKKIGEIEHSTIVKINEKLKEFLEL